MSPLFVHKNIAVAKTITTDFYTDTRYFDEAKEKIFAFSWQFIGHQQLAPETGSCYPFTLLENYLNEPLLLSRDHNGVLHCVSNVCTHRGNILLTESCKGNHIRCRYHGRLFRLDGKFHSMPEFREVKKFPSSHDDLHQLPLFEWGNWLFTSLGSRISAKQIFNEMIERINWMPVTEFVFRPDLSKEYSINAHWALYCENYLEGFHIPFIHAGLNAVIDYGSYTTELFKYSNLQVGLAKDGEDCFEIPEAYPDHGKKIAAYYFWVFPNMMFNFYPWGLSVNIVQPVSQERTKVLFLTYVWKESKLEKGAGASLDKVELEDEEVVQNVQKGIRSRFYTHGRYSVKREQGTHHFHQLITTFMK